MASAIARPRALAAVLAVTTRADHPTSPSGPRHEQTATDPWPAVTVNANGSRAEHGRRKPRPAMDEDARRCWVPRLCQNVNGER